MASAKTKTAMVIGATAILVAGALIVLSKKPTTSGTSTSPAEAQLEASDPKLKSYVEALPQDLKAKITAMPPAEQKRMVALDPGAQLSPFTKVQIDGGTVTVGYDGAEYQLAAIEDISTSDMLAFCDKQYGDRSHQRFAEDLVVVLDDMGHPVNADHTVSLSLLDPKTGQKKDIASATMTKDNRDAIRDAARSAKAGAPQAKL